ncbi:MAG: TIGR04282 family arsenosugar biosynthesis glycosyltransferase [Pseudomonadota bacterium]
MLTKAPVAGLVKTRLGLSIGHGRAAAIYRGFVRCLGRRLADRSYSVTLAVDPPTAQHQLAALWGRPVQSMAQARGGLGERIRAALDAGRRRGAVVVIGADAPAVSARCLVTAFKALDRADIVLGPAQDGGFWLIGISGRRADALTFDGVRWSSASTLSDVIASLPSKMRVVKIHTHKDIDEVEELEPPVVTAPLPHLLISTQFQSSQSS